MFYQFSDVPPLSKIIPLFSPHHIVNLLLILHTVCSNFLPFFPTIFTFHLTFLSLLLSYIGIYKWIWQWDMVEGDVFQLQGHKIPHISVLKMPMSNRRNVDPCFPLG